MTTVDISNRFATAVDYIQNLPTKPDPDSDVPVLNISLARKQIFYGLYKQATKGDNNDTKPSFFDPVGRAKWTAWESYKGVSSSDAKQKYIEELLAVLDESPSHPEFEKFRRLISESKSAPGNAASSATPSASTPQWPGTEGMGMLNTPQSPFSSSQKRNNTSSASSSADLDLNDDSSDVISPLRTPGNELSSTIRRGIVARSVFEESSQSSAGSNIEQLMQAMRSRITALEEKVAALEASQAKASLSTSSSSSSSSSSTTPKNSLVSRLLKHRGFNLLWPFLVFYICSKMTSKRKR